MTKSSLPTIETLHKLLICDAKAGTLVWRERELHFFRSVRDCNAWNARYAGKSAMITIDDHGYRYGKIFNKKHKAHRVIWAMETGEWPVDQIDHEDHNRANNRFKNLRDVSNMVNGQNRTLNANNNSGICGVSWHKRDRAWRANIVVEGKQISLGYFKKKKAAIDARKKAELVHGFHHNHGVN